jgi:hypothetical protein
MITTTEQNKSYKIIKSPDKLTCKYCLFSKLQGFSRHKTKGCKEIEIYKQRLKIKKITTKNQILTKIFQYFFLHSE